ncbi:MAG: VOC family protein [Candidatus Poribacteria bacterium]|nr:VOC family protein [Candidatus Poribacteria bacterium]
MTVTFDHVHLRCEDLDGTVSYYEKIFDGKVLETVDVGRLKVIRMEIGGGRIFLSSKLGDMEVEDTSGNPRWGLFQLAFTVEDLDATVAELQAKGAELDYLLPEAKRAFFKGPDNVHIELIEM